EEILPAEASVYEKVSPNQANPLPDGSPALAAAPPYEGEGRPARAPGIRRSPHASQLAEMNGGPACPPMACRHSGRAVRISLVREAVHTSTDGTSLAGITRGAEELGLAAQSVRASKSRLDELPLPAIVHWEGNHWIVLYAVGDGHVRVSDPARGIRRIRRDE